MADLTIRRASIVEGEGHRSFAVAKLTHRRIPEALPLIRATWSNVDLETWRNFAKAFTRGSETSSGALALIDASRALCGILVYRVEPDLDGWLIFSVPLFSAVDMHNSSAAAGALLEAAIARAHEIGCRRLHIRLRPEQAAMVRSIAALGMSNVAGVYGLALGARAAPN